MRKKEKKLSLPVLFGIVAVAFVLGLTLFFPTPAPPRVPETYPETVADGIRVPFDRQQYETDDPFYATLRNVLNFASQVRAARKAPRSKWAAEGRMLLTSEKAEDRALGGVLLFFAGKLDEGAVRTLVGDLDLFVPLTVFDWVRDFGTDEEIEAFENGIGLREISDEDLVAFLAASAQYPGGGRSALGLFLARHEDDEIFEASRKFLSSSDVAYDVFEQAFLKLLEPENREEAEDFIDALEREDKLDGNGLMIQMLWKLKGATKAERGDGEEETCKVWDISRARLGRICDADMGLVIRDVANYLEYGLRRDNPDFEPVIEEGVRVAAGKFLEKVKASEPSLTYEELEALERLEAYVKRIP